MLRRAAGVLTLVAAAMACAPASEPPGVPEAPLRWSVWGGHVRDAQGRAVMLRGFNLSGDHKFPPYLDFHTREDFHRLRAEWGMNAIRYIMTWAAVMPQRGAPDMAYLAAVRERLDWAEAEGVLVVLDMHQDIFGEGFVGGDGAPRWACDEAAYAAYTPPDEWYLAYLDANVTACFDRLWTDPVAQQDFADAWMTVARAFADHPAVVGLDVLNEPWLGSFSLDDFEPLALQPLYEKVVTDVRTVAPHWVAFLEPMALRNLGQPTRLRALGVPNVAYAPHSYDTAAERSVGFDLASVPRLKDNVRALAAEARALGGALWVGEYGGMTMLPNHTAYLRASVEVMEEVWAGQMLWHHGRDSMYGVLNDDGSDKPETLDALVHPAPLRVDGTPGTWMYDTPTRTLTLTWTAAGQAPTLVAVPARSHPEGVRVTCTGCTAGDPVDGVLRVDAAAGAQVTLVVAPR